MEEVECQGQLRTVRVLTRTFVCENLVQGDAIELAVGVLIQTRYPDITNLFGFYDRLPKFVRCVQLESRRCNASVKK